MQGIDSERAASGLDGTVHFWCDAGLGGLARWLRAAGYEAAWDSEIDDSELLKKARESRAIILTSGGIL